MVMVQDFLDLRRGHQPLRAARYELGYSVEALASRLSVGAPTLRNTEWGIYNDVPPRIKAFYVEEGFDSEWIAKENTNYRVNTRISFGEELGDLFPAPSPNFLQQLYRNMECGRLTLAKCLCVQPAELMRMDSTDKSNFPESVFNALSQAISHDYAVQMLNAWPRKSQRGD